ncbi:MAG: aldo/keto reductase [Bacteroidota bacterium]
MNYHLLGQTGLKVSSLCFGTMTFGDAADESMSEKLYAMCRDAGINFFDCANVYAKGKSEHILGRLIKAHREEVIIATKAYYPMSKDVNGRGSSRVHLYHALEGSLKRLDTDYIDIYYLHNFDETVSLYESLATLNDFVRQGKIRYIGLSNFAAWQVMKAISVTEKHLWSSIACIQPMYNLLKRQAESEIFPMAMDQRLGVFPYSPMGGGYLSGKYLKNKDAKGRFDSSHMYQKRYSRQGNEEIAAEFVALAEESGFHPASLAVAWAGSHSAVTAPIIGARNVAQLETGLKAVEVDMTDELRARISALSPTPVQANDRTEEQM